MKKLELTMKEFNRNLKALISKTPSIKWFAHALLIAVLETIQFFAIMLVGCKYFMVAKTSTIDGAALVAAIFIMIEVACVVFTAVLVFAIFDKTCFSLSKKARTKKRKAKTMDEIAKEVHTYRIGFQAPKNMSEIQIAKLNQQRMDDLAKAVHDFRVSYKVANGMDENNALDFFINNDKEA